MKTLTRLALTVLLGVTLSGCNMFVNTPPVEDTSRQAALNEQLAIDTVNLFIATYARISQDLDTANWHDIENVAGHDQAQAILDDWAKDTGWHMVGTPSFEADGATLETSDDRQSEYTVTGCYVKNGSYWADKQGTPATATSKERKPATYKVTITAEGHGVVTTLAYPDGDC